MKLILQTNALPDPVEYSNVVRAWINKDLGRVNIERKSSQTVFDLPGEIVKITALCPAGKFPTFEGSVEMDLVGPGDVIFVYQD